MDIYRDYFTREELVRVLSQAPYTPGMLGTLGIFEPVPLTSTTMAIEVESKDAGKVLTAIPRGSARSQSSLDKRKVVTFTTETFGDQGAVYADEVLNARGAGTAGAKEIIESRRARTVAKLRLTMDLTHEKLRMNALLSPASTEFGTAASGQIIAVQTDATKTRQEIFNKIILPIESAMDGVPFGGIGVLCSDGYWADLLENKQIRETYLNWTAAAQLRESMLTDSFPFAGVTWMRYRGTSACKIPDNEARAMPINTQGLFFAGFAPNDTLESVGSAALGQPYYIGSKPIVDSQGTKGYEISIQSHVKMVCGRPNAIIPITKS
jgi:hypothetical protein